MDFFVFEVILYNVNVSPFYGIFFKKNLKLNLNNSLKAYLEMNLKVKIIDFENFKITRKQNM